MVTCMSFSASANVAGLTAGPEPIPVAKVGGAPGVDGGVVDWAAGCGSPPRHAAAATSTPSGARIRNCRRVFMDRELTAVCRRTKRYAVHGTDVNSATMSAVLW